jgi:hypothetical protein
LTYNTETGQLSGYTGAQNEIQQEFLRMWWKILYSKVWPLLSKPNEVNIVELFDPCALKCLAFSLHACFILHFLFLASVESSDFKCCQYRSGNLFSLLSSKTIDPVS